MRHYYEPRAKSYYDSSPMYYEPRHEKRYEPPPPPRPIDLAREDARARRDRGQFASTIKRQSGAAIMQSVDPWSLSSSSSYYHRDGDRTTLENKPLKRSSTLRHEKVSGSVYEGNLNYGHLQGEVRYTNRHGTGLSGGYSLPTQTASLGAHHRSYGVSADLKPTSARLGGHARGHSAHTPYVPYKTIAAFV